MDAKDLEEEKKSLEISVSELSTERTRIDREIAEIRRDIEALDRLLARYGRQHTADRQLEIVEIVGTTEQPQATEAGRFDGMTTMDAIRAIFRESFPKYISPEYVTDKLVAAKFPGSENRAKFHNTVGPSVNRLFKHGELGATGETGRRKYRLKSD